MTFAVYLGSQGPCKTAGDTKAGCVLVLGDERELMSYNNSNDNDDGDNTTCYYLVPAQHYYSILYLLIHLPLEPHHEAGECVACR